MICICAVKSSDVKLIEDLPGSEEGERCTIKCDYTPLSGKTEWCMKNNSREKKNENRMKSRIV